MNKIKKTGNMSNIVSNSLTTKKNFVILPNILYILLVSSSVSVILTKLFGIETVRNIIELYIIVLIFTIAILYKLLKDKMTLDKLETKSILYFLAFVIFIGFFGLFLKFTSMEKESLEGKIFGLVFLLLVFALVNIIFFIIGMG
jgi:hypothetical protein